LLADADAEGEQQQQVQLQQVQVQQQQVQRPESAASTSSSTAAAAAAARDTTPAPSRPPSSRRPSDLPLPPAASQLLGSASAPTAAWFRGFADRYLAPPTRSDQLSLFSEVQRLVARKGLVPVLHCTARRMLFEIPFDDSIKISIDMDIKMLALDESGERTALALAALAACSLQRSLKRSAGRLRPAQLLAHLRRTGSIGSNMAGGGSDAGGGDQGGGEVLSAANDAEAGQPPNAAPRQQQQQQSGAAARSSNDLQEDESEDQEEEEEAEWLAWELWRRLFNENVAEADESYALPYAVLKVSEGVLTGQTLLPPCCGVSPDARTAAVAAACPSSGLSHSACRCSRLVAALSPTRPNPPHQPVSLPPHLITPPTYQKTHTQISTAAQPGPLWPSWLQTLAASDYVTEVREDTLNPKP